MLRPRGGPVKVKKVVMVAVIATVFFYVVTRPHEAAATADGILAWLRDGAEAIILFVNNVFA